MSQLQYIIAGGSSGIGLEITKQLLDLGNIVHVISRGLKEIEISHTNLHTYKADLSAIDSHLPLLEGAVSGLIYCPGSINLKPFRAIKPEDFMSDFNINLVGAVRVIQKYLPNLQLSESASIILFSTVAVQTGMSFHSSVAAAKGAVEGLGRSLASEFAPKIRVNVIAPSLTQTPLASKLINTESKLDLVRDRHPLKRIGAPDEIASLATYLLSPKASWITGQVLKIDGGISAIK